MASPNPTLEVYRDNTVTSRFDPEVRYFGTSEGHLLIRDKLVLKLEDGTVAKDQDVH